MLADAGLHCILTARMQVAVDRGLHELGRRKAVEGQRLDVADQTSVDAFFGWLQKTHGQIDVLVNNAGRVYGRYDAGVEGASSEAIAAASDNNALGAWRIMQQALPMMNARGYGRIVNVSSGMGALDDMGPGAIAYRVSKTALNALTRIAAHEAESNVKVNAVCPGWVRTALGGPSATRNLHEGATGIVWAATLPGDGPNGGFFRDGQAIEW